MVYAALYLGFETDFIGVNGKLYRLDDNIDAMPQIFSISVSCMISRKTFI